MAKTACPDDIAPPIPPAPAALKAGSDAADNPAGATGQTTFHEPLARGTADPPEAVGAQCHITLRLTFFFDGTGNNRLADEPTHQDTNVAKLFRAHEPLDESAGIYRFYIPGVGTYFPEIGDAGGTKLGLGTGDRGQDRIDWAIKQLEKTVAKHPPDKLVTIRVATFGFSRGAAEARAFANQVANRCSGTPNAPRWKQGDVPLDFYFLGLFDTVASVGLPATANLVTSLLRTKQIDSIATTLNKRRADAMSGMPALAFGKPGADPTPFIEDGHMGYGGHLRIPPMVKKCVSLVAAHEQRNSFPLDSVIQGAAYPSNCEEFVYPGAHSDVGGGYRPGDQNKSTDIANLISLMPLYHMHAMAIEYGVPLEGTKEFSDQRLQPSFKATEKLIEHWNHYMQAAGGGGKPLGDMFLAHMRLWFAWRFQRIHQFRPDGQWSDDQVVPDQARLKAEARQYDEERQQQQARIDRLKNEPTRLAAEKNLERARRNLEAKRARLRIMGGTLSQEQQAMDEAQDTLDQANEPLRRAQGRLSTVPGSDFVKHLHAYDVGLIKDMEKLTDLIKQGVWGTRNTLRPFHRMLLETYEDEFVNDSGLRDQKIIYFFENYVHDSLAGFAKDATSPSDPRCVYIGGDSEAKYANARKAQELPPSETA